jgi:polyisoprenoid-binding protein YceI
VNAITRTALVAAALLPWAAPAAAQPATYPIAEESTIEYSGRHLTGGWTGTSRSVDGAVTFDATQPAQTRIRVSAPVESFRSGNSSRDSNMFDAVSGSRHRDVHFESGQVTVERWEERDGGWEGRWLVEGTLTFNGVPRTVVVPVDVRAPASGPISASTEFPVLLSDHQVRRPRLLLAPISDEIRLRVRLAVQRP